MDFAELQFVKMSPRPVVSTKATRYSIGLDLYSPDNYLIHPKRQVLIPIQIKPGVALGYYGRITSKSGLDVKHEICVDAEVIDPNYTGEIKVLLVNDGRHYYQVTKEIP